MRLPMSGLQKHARRHGQPAHSPKAVFLRVVTSPAYPNRRLTLTEAALHLRHLIANHAETHRFFYDNTSLIDSTRFDLGKLLGHRQITDLHLLGICLRFHARLVTFDKGIITLTSALVAGSVEILLLSSGEPSHQQAHD